MSKTFKYTARNNAGKTVKGKVSARDSNEATTNLRKQGLSVLKVKEATSLAKMQIGGTRPGCRKGELELFTRQLSTMISAGIPLLECLEVLREQVESPGFSRAIEGLIEEIRGGSDFSAALGQFPKVFTRIYVSMVRAGEASGQLDEILNRLSDFAEKIAWCREHDQECQRIAAEGRAFANRLGCEAEKKSAVERINAAFPPPF